MHVEFILLPHQQKLNCFTDAAYLINNLYQKKERCFILLDTDSECEQFDETLWTFEQTSFVPHQLITSPENLIAPILIGKKLIHSQSTTLINLSDTIPDRINQFKTIIEFIPNDEVQLTKARKHYRYFKQLNADITHTDKREKINHANA